MQSGIKHIVERWRPVKLTESKKANQVVSIAKTSVKKPAFTQRLRSYLLYFLVYRFGKFFPENWPSTTIYICRKRLT